MGREGTPGSRRHALAQAKAGAHDRSRRGQPHGSSPGDSGAAALVEARGWHAGMHGEGVHGGRIQEVPVQVPRVCSLKQRRRSRHAWRPQCS